MKNFFLFYFLIASALYAQIQSNSTIQTKHKFTGSLPVSINKSALWHDKSIIWEEKDTKKIYNFIKDFKNQDLKNLLENGKNANSYFYFKSPYNFLYLASSVNNTEAVKLLFQYGANPNLPSIPTEEGYAVLPISSFIQNNDYKMINTFLQYNASLNVKQTRYEKINCSVVRDRTILPPIFYSKTKEMIEFLVSKGAKIDQKSADGKTILDFIHDTKLKAWIINTYKLQTSYFRCTVGHPVHLKIIKIIHTEDGYKQYDADNSLINEVKNDH